MFTSLLEGLSQHDGDLFLFSKMDQITEILGSCGYDFTILTNETMKLLF